MSVASQVSRVQYTVSAVGQTLTVPWYFLESGHVGVVRGKGADEVELTLNAHYTVNGAGNQSGGSIKLTDAAANVGDVITIYRDGPFTQPNDYPLAGQFPAATIEETDDASTMIDQQLRNQTERSLRVSIAEEPIAPIKGGLQPNGVIGVDENGNPVSWHKDDFKGDKGDKGDDGKDGTDGANAMVYWLELDAACFLKHEDGTFNPEKAYVRALKRESDGPTEWMGECALRIEQLVNGAWVNDWESANWHGSDYGNRAPLPDSVAVRFSLYKAGAFSELLDARILPVSPSGALGNGGGGGNPQPPQPPPPPPPPAPPDTYELELSHSNLSRNADWSFAEPNLVVAAWRYPQGTGPKVGYAGRFEIHLGHTGGDYNPYYTSISDETTQSVQTATGWGHDLNSIRVRLYESGGLSTLLDEQVCTVTNWAPPPLPTPEPSNVYLHVPFPYVERAPDGRFNRTTMRLLAKYIASGNNSLNGEYVKTYIEYQDGSESLLSEAVIGVFGNYSIDFTQNNNIPTTAKRLRFYLYEDNSLSKLIDIRTCEINQVSTLMLVLRYGSWPVGTNSNESNIPSISPAGIVDPYDEGGSLKRRMFADGTQVTLNAKPSVTLPNGGGTLPFKKWVTNNPGYFTQSGGLSAIITVNKADVHVRAEYGN